jgi:hypothetical protein
LNNLNCDIEMAYFSFKFPSLHPRLKSVAHFEQEADVIGSRRICGEREVLCLLGVKVTLSQHTPRNLWRKNPGVTTHRLTGKPSILVTLPLCIES